MKTPRDVSGERLKRLFLRLGYLEARQEGSHVRMTFIAAPEHHVTVPMHKPLRIGTLGALLKDVAMRHGVTVESLIEDL